MATVWVAQRMDPVSHLNNLRLRSVCYGHLLLLSRRMILRICLAWKTQVKCGVIFCMFAYYVIIFTYIMCVLHPIWYSVIGVVSLTAQIESFLGLGNTRPEDGPPVTSSGPELNVFLENIISRFAVIDDIARNITWSNSNCTIIYVNVLMTVQIIMPFGPMLDFDQNLVLGNKERTSVMASQGVESWNLKPLGVIG